MSRHLRFVMAQLNLLVGDVAGNEAAVLGAIDQARDDHKADVVVFPELTLTGYPPDDLLLRNDFIADIEASLERIRERARDITVVIGAPRRVDAGLLNAAYVFSDAATLGVYGKQRLPTYGVFDERRYFVPATEPCVVSVDGCRVGVTICEDAWHPGPVAQSAEAGADLIVNINASPFDRHKWTARESVLRARVSEAGVPILYCNMSGGQDEVVYDGSSCAFDADGSLRVRAPRFRTGLHGIDCAREADGWRVSPGVIDEDHSDAATVYEALVCGVGDYVRKNGFPGVLIGLSGGMDSALTACIAVDALGRDRVECVMMPTRYTSDMSLTDAGAIAENLGVAYHTVAIEPIFEAFMAALEPAFAGKPPDITEENLQSRARGTILMALSNKGGKLVLATGNKSEMAVGYATLYGDMVGGFAPLKDIFKTEVYRLARHRNAISAVLPENVFTRPPTAELRHDQKDTDSLPDYPALDALLAGYVESDRAVDDLVHSGYSRDVVEKVVRMVHRNEYKRRQAPPGVKVTTKAFGRDRRYPITSGFGRT